jgi:site-specific DNA-adenine methylase
MTKSYQGGKGAMGVAEQIINRMPKHRVYIETHLGGGRVLLKKKPALTNIAIEIDTAVLDNFRYSIAKDVDGISYFNESATEWLIEKGERLNKEYLVYCDPPYVMSTRKSQVPMYKHEYDDFMHTLLIGTLNKLECFVMLSGYESELYDELLDPAKWHKFTFNAMTRQGVRTEALWCNFNPDDYIKHDYSFMGDNFRERERIKRKGKRWVKNLAKLPTDERNFLLSNIADEFGLELSNHF